MLQLPHEYLGILEEPGASLQITVKMCHYVLSVSCIFITHCGIISSPIFSTE